MDCENFTLGEKNYALPCSVSAPTHTIVSIGRLLHMAFPSLVQ
jgi:hypothetical protein